MLVCPASPPDESILRPRGEGDREPSRGPSTGPLSPAPQRGRVPRPEGTAHASPLPRSPLRTLCTLPLPWQRPVTSPGW